MLFDVICLNFETVADEIAKWYGYCTYTVSDVITVCDGRCRTYAMADVIALVQHCGGCWYHLFVDY